MDVEAVDRDKFINIISDDDGLDSIQLGIILE
jgi:hypothetical protein